LAGGAGGELGRDALSRAEVAPEGGRRARVGFGDGFALPSGAGGVLTKWREVLTLPIGSYRARAGAGAPVVYLRSNRRWHKFGLTSGAPILPPRAIRLLKHIHIIYFIIHRNHMKNIKHSLDDQQKNTT
jgi:hypothetical protein